MTREELKKSLKELQTSKLTRLSALTERTLTKRKTTAALKTEIETLKQSKTELETQIDEMSKNAHTVDEYKNRLEELKKQYAEEAQKAEAERKAQEEAARIETRFNAAAGDKKIYALSAIKAEYLKKFTEALKAEENAGRSDSEIFSEMTKDDARAFENVIPIKLGGINTNSFVNEKNTITRDDIMKIKNTKERHRAIAENPELFGIE